MHASRFDQFVQALSTAETRRNALQTLLALPLASAFLTLLGDEESIAGRRRRKRRQKKCKRSRVCNGKCGTVKKNNCKTRDCGLCPCDATSCAVCQTCNTAGVCEPSPDGTICGTRNDAADFLRCCGGICPNPVCVPNGSVPSVPCSGSPDCAGLQCCSQKTAQCSAPCFCLFSDAGEACAADDDCNDPLVHPEVRSCICGLCVIP